MSTQKILIIGSGKRVVEAALPALNQLQAEFEIAGIYARTSKTVRACNREYQVDAIDALRTEDINAVDLVYLAVTKNAVPEVLGRLAQADRPSLDLLIDTPVVRFKHMSHIGKLERWRNAWVAEDCSTLPWLDPIRSAVAAGEIGEVQSVAFYQSAYAYHGLAMAKTLLGEQAIRSAKRTAWSRHVGCRQLNFSGGRKAFIFEPRDYSIGRLSLMGSKGSISNYTYKANGNLCLEPIIDDGLWTGFQVGDHRSAMDAGEVEILRQGDSSQGIIARMDDLKQVGFLRLLKRIHSGHGAYPLLEALDDMVVDYHLEKFSRYLANPFTSARSGLARMLLKSATRFGG